MCDFQSKEEGSRCGLVYNCKYPEKKTCQAVHTEIAFLLKLQEKLVTTISHIDNSIETLRKETQA